MDILVQEGNRRIILLNIFNHVVYFLSSFLNYKALSGSFLAILPYSNAMITKCLDHIIVSTILIIIIIIGGLRVREGRVKREKIFIYF
jgi:hypothetical protein